METHSLPLKLNPDLPSYPASVLNPNAIYHKHKSKLLTETGYQVDKEKMSASFHVVPSVSSRKKKKIVPLNTEWHNLAGSSLELTDPLNFIKIADIIEQPKFTNTDNQLLCSLLPFILQKIKMWDCKILTPEYLCQLLPISEEGPIWVDDDIDDYIVANEQVAENCSSGLQVLSKLDILTMVVASADVTVLSDIFQNISKFPIALPLILPNPVPNNNGKMVMVTSALEKCLIKWEQNGKQSRENYLFKSPYKLITAIRIGNSDSVGKSSFLNQLFLQSHIFQCKGQPGNGKPIGLNGSAEFIWLTKDTCKEFIWSAIQAEMEAALENEILLLANVHGDALQNENTLTAMNSMTSKYIVFVMPDETTNKISKEKLAKICGKENLLYIYVDPKITVDQYKTLKTHLITDSNSTLNTLKQYIKQAIKTGKTMTNENPNCNSIAKLPTISTKEATSFMDLVHNINNSVGYVRDMLRLQKIKKSDVDQYWQAYTNNPHLVEIIASFVKILYSSLSQRRIGINHVDHELSILSAKKLAGFSSKLIVLQEKRNNLVDTDPLWEETNDKIAKINNEFANSLSLNDFLRELSIAYEIVCIHGNPESISLVSRLPALYADLLIEGRTLEILDGDAGSVNGIWLESVCHAVCQKLGNLKVFVVSILGLQSSGKSTLLNALFGCKFATSVGKCTKGLYMRLMLLEKSFKKQLGLDAILVVDTEGLGSPESMLDPNSESKDRTMATFAMAISNLTLINVAGESNKEMVDILQIVILTMARMEETDLSPDLLLVQQVPEGGHAAALAKGVDNFCKALEEAVKVIKSQDIDLGVRTLTNLKTLKQRLRQREILYQLRPFKSGASPQSPPSEEYCQDVLGLRAKIIKEYSSEKQFIYFCTWHKLLKCYWEAVQKENFALRFTSIRQVQEFIEVNALMAAVKNDLSMAFHHHRKSAEAYIKEKLSLLEIEEITSKFDQLYGHCQPDDPHTCESCKKAQNSTKLLLEFVKHTISVSINETEMNINAFIHEMQETSKSQMFGLIESLKIQLGKVSEFDIIFNQTMQETATMREISIDEVWNALCSNVKKKFPTRFDENKVIEDIIKEYGHIPDKMAWKDELEKMLKSHDGRKHALGLKNAKENKILGIIKSTSDLKPNEWNSLSDNLIKVVEKIISNSKRLRMCYDETLVSEHRKKVENLLRKFEDDFKISLTNQFKHNAIFYSLQFFIEYILQLQADWNGQYDPFCIFLKKKQEYIQKIDMHLANQSPRQEHSFGISVAKKLMQAAQSVCITTFDVTNHLEKWATNPEGIRLRYLVYLAEELKRGNEDTVLEHFQNPHQMLSDWYIQTVEYITSNVIVPMLKDTFMNECTAIESQIAANKSWKELQDFISWYLTKGGEYVSFEKVAEDMLEKLKVEILKEMSKFVKSYMEGITVDILPVNNDRFVNILGCTATCPGCSAICWGTKNHENGLAKYKYHFTCHQPKGLAGVVDKVFGTLDFESCCHSGAEENSLNDAPESVFGNDDVQWLNKMHPVEEYKQLMDWFFLKLRGKLTETFRSKYPRMDAKETDRVAYLNYLDKHLDHILNVIKHKSLL